MPLFTRYLVAELLKVFLVVLAGMTLLVMLFGVAKEAYVQGLGLAQIALLLPYILPEALRFTLPGTILFATCSVYGRMASTNEVVAVKSLGISPMALLWPVFILAFLLSLATVWINDLAVTWGRSNMQRVVVESVEEIAYSVLQSQRSYSTSQFAITVKRVEGRKLIQPALSFRPSDNAPRASVTAQEAELHSNPADNTLTIIFYNGTVDAGGGGGKVSVMVPDTFTRVIPLADASRQGDASMNPSNRPLRVLPEEIEQQKIVIRDLEQNLATQAAFQMMTGDFSVAADASSSTATTLLRDERFRLYRLQAESHRRWANGFSCLCFVLIGAPLAVRLRHSDFLTVFFACFLPILVGYYPLLAYGVDRAKAGALPPYSVWLGNAILAACGAWLLRKVIRY